MNSIDLGPLVKGCMVVIWIAIATGHYGDLWRWARREAASALVMRPLPNFFGPENRFVGQKPVQRVHIRPMPVGGR